MARKSIPQYVFTPGTSGLGTIKVPGRINLEDFLAVYDTTNNISIYNFGSPTQGGTVTWAAGVTADFPTAYDGVTTLTLDLDTSTLSASDKLSIYVEAEYLSVIPWSFGQDAIGRISRHCRAPLVGAVAAQRLASGLADRPRVGHW